MTKRLFFILFMAVGCLTACAQHIGAPTKIALQVRYYDPYEGLDIGQRGPMAPPVVYQEDNTLTFVADHPEYVLYIKDEDEEVVYSTVVTSAETEVTLPSYLSGTYEIDLVMGNWMFTGWIEL